MSWNYRILKKLTHKGEPYYAIHEAYYDDKGEPNGWTKEPVTFVGDTPEELVRSLEMALNDAQRHSILEDE